jgi:hypothetical protein
MKLGNNKKFILIFILFIIYPFSTLAVDKIKTVPLINLENLSPTFEEDKDELEKIEKTNINLNGPESADENSNVIKNDKVYINIKALDKITAKISNIKLTVGEILFFNTLEIKVLKCLLSEKDNFKDTVAYIQVKDTSAQDNNQVFLFNGWTFISSPTLRSIDHPVYDLWVTSCENV